MAEGMFSSWESQVLQGGHLQPWNSQPGLTQARPNTSGKPLGVPKPVQPGSLTPQMGVGATNDIIPTAHPRLIPLSVTPGESRHKIPPEPPLLLGMGPQQVLELWETPHKTPARTTTAPPTRLLQVELSHSSFSSTLGLFPLKSPRRRQRAQDITPAASLSAPLPVPRLFHAEPRPFPRDVPCPEAGEAVTSCPPAPPEGPVPSAVPVRALLWPGHSGWGAGEGSRSRGDPSGMDPGGDTELPRGQAGHDCGRGRLRGSP